MKSQTPPPRLARGLLLRFLRKELAEEVQGDLDEKFYRTHARSSLFKARLSYWYEVINYLRPFAIRKPTRGYSNHYSMFQNYFKIGWRSMSRQKVYSSIKIGGFAIGIAACLLIGLFIRQELSYDRHYKDGSLLYRVYRSGTYAGQSGRDVWFPAPFGKTLQEDYPEIQMQGRYNATEFMGAGSNEIRRLDRQENSHEEGVVFMDQAMLDMFEVPFEYGDARHALSEAKTIVISKRKADKYFPGENPIGQVLVLNNDESKQYKVGGVMKNFPSNAHLQFDFLISLKDVEFWEGEGSNWDASNYITYVKVNPGTDISALEAKMKRMVERYYLPTLGEKREGDVFAWMNSLQFRLQPVHEIYLNQDEINDGIHHGDVRYIWLFGAIAIVILLIACINFINLSTARSANRAKEVGLRKVVGSMRASLIKQFLTESSLFSIFSFILGLLITWVALPYFNLLLGKDLAMPWGEWWLFPLLGVSAIFVGVLAGLYPSFYLSGFKPVHVLKGNVSRGTKSSFLRSSLVVFQFTTSIVLIVGTLIVHRQMDFILHSKIGFDKEQVIVLQGAHTLKDQVVPLKAELSRLPEVKSATISSYLPVAGTTRNGQPFWVEGTKETMRGTGSQHWAVDHDYVRTMGMKILSGRDFSRELASDSQAMIVNETMARALQNEHLVGQTVVNGWNGKWKVIGIVEDFHFESFRQRIEPLCLIIGRSQNNVSVKVNTADMAATLQSLTRAWKQFSPGQPVRYSFLDDSYARTYEDVQRLQYIFSSFSILAIVVACLGLFALSAFMVEQRSKEISIRLILGASIKNVLQLLTFNFFRLVLIALVIAAPLGWYIMERWLEDYAYRIPIGWDIFLLAGLIAVGIAALTISQQALKAALANPADNLRSE